MNKVLIIGRLGADPKEGNGYCYFSLATSVKKKDGTELTSWHPIFCHGKTAEIAGKYLRKGDQCYIEGSISYKQNEDKTTSASINCFHIEFLSKNDKHTKQVDKQDEPAKLPHYVTEKEELLKSIGAQVKSTKAAEGYYQAEFTTDDIPF